jgi:uroporphyrinogen-III synthase
MALAERAPARAVLITRPQPGAEETAARITAMGFVPILAPVLTIRRLPAMLPAAVDAVVITSRNALASLPQTLRAVPLFAVGEATAAAARRCGFETVFSADADAAALADLIGCTFTSSPARRLLHLSGKSQGRDLARRLRELGFVVYRRVVYQAVPEPALAEAARAALGAGSVRAALFFSAETARSFVRLAVEAGLRDSVRSTEACAIGRPAAVALEPLPWRSIRVATRPNQSELLALLQ